VSELKPHPLAEIFPRLDDAALQELAADIRKNGLRQAIVTHQGQVLDGRKRLAACKIAEVEPRFKEFAGDDPLGYVVSLNLKRRHLSETQRAMIR
jgi:ParB-like nuclease domain